MTNNKKTQVAIIRAFLGIYGVDRFILGQRKKGIKEIVISVILCALGFLIIPSIVMCVRSIIMLVQGLKMLGKTPEEVLEFYNDHKKDKNEMPKQEAENELTQQNVDLNEEESPEVKKEPSEKRQKTLVALMRAFFGELGIDKFLQKNLVEALITVGWTVILGVVDILMAVFNILILTNIMASSPAISVISLIVLIISIIRRLLFFISGLFMLPGSDKVKEKKIRKVPQFPKEISKGKKLALALTRAFAGIYGVDRFILKQVKKGVTQLVITLGLIFVFYLSFLSFLFLDVTSAFIIVYIVYMLVFGYLSVREIIFFVQGMIFLKKDPDEVLERYREK